VGAPDGCLRPILRAEVEPSKQDDRCNPLLCSLDLLESDTLHEAHIPL
jgi:hypothetical protein